MASYSGQITLVKVSESSGGGGGIGLSKVTIWYAASSNGEIPPSGQGGSSLIIQTESETLAFNQVSAVFKIDAQYNLYATKTGTEDPIILQTDVNEILGTTGWIDTIPQVKMGEYLWIKTIYLYTDGSSSVSYSVSKNGEASYTWIKYADDQYGLNMSDDATDKKYLGIAYNKTSAVESNNPKDYTWSQIQGEPGAPAQNYYLDVGQEEILMNASRDGNLIYSPEKLKIWLKKDKENLNISKDNLKAYYFAETWEEIPENYIKSSEGTEFLSLEGFEIFFPGIESTIKLDYEYKESDVTFNIRKIIPVRYAIKQDLATLGLNAFDITAAIQNTKLKFSAEGLLVQNGGFEIQNNSGEQVLCADEGGNLSIKGTINATSGSFTGEIHAESGEFSGRIEANSGSIGGFIIESGLLKSIDENNSLQLDGENGKIIANNIELGVGAKISDYINLGENVQLLNPRENNNNAFLIVKNNDAPVIEFYDTGYMSIGEENKGIIINGQNGSIYTSGFSNGGNGWSISPDKAIFNNITAMGSLKASVFEYGKIQAIGGMIIVRPSSRIIGIIGENEIQLETINGFEENDICLINPEVDENGIDKIFVTVTEVNYNDKTLIISKEESVILEDLIGLPIVNYGHEGSVGIGINASTNDDTLAPESISVFEFDGGKNLSTKIILGKIPDQKEIYKSISNSYGLYAENVLLKGSLITMQENGAFCGINTIYPNPDEGPKSSRLTSVLEGPDGFIASDILLWAGAELKGDISEKDAIEKARFFVDRNGYMYAGGGYFEGSIISNAIIQAAEIKTAIITGSGEAPALIIRDAIKGISFKNEEKSIFELNSTELKAEVESIKFNGNVTIGEEYSFSVSKLGVENGIGISNNLIESATSTSKINLDDNRIKLLIGEQSILSIDANEMDVQKDLRIENNLLLNEKMRYEKVENGYDLYIVSE